MIVSLALIALCLVVIALKLCFGVVRMKDVDRAKVYSEHLGKKLSNPEPRKEESNG